MGVYLKQNENITHFLFPENYENGKLAWTQY